MKTTSVPPPSHRLTRAVLAAAGTLVLVISASLFAGSPLLSQLWTGCVSFVDNVRALW